VTCCSGQGNCINDTVCECDPGFAGPTCAAPPSYGGDIGGNELLATCTSDEPGCDTVRSNFIVEYNEIGYAGLCDDLDLTPHPTPGMPAEVLRFMTYFPANASGSQAQGQFPILVFSHGQGQFLDAYPELHAYLALNDIPVFSISQPSDTVPSERADRIACMLRVIDQNYSNAVTGEVFIGGHSRGGEAAQLYGERLKVSQDSRENWATLAGVLMLAPGWLPFDGSHPTDVAAPLYVWGGGFPDDDLGDVIFQDLTVLDTDSADSSTASDPTTLVATYWRGFVHNDPGGKCPTNGELCEVDSDCTDPDFNVCLSIGLCSLNPAIGVQCSTEEGRAWSRTYLALPLIHAVQPNDGAKEVIVGEIYPTEIDNLFGAAGGDVIKHQYRDGPAYGGTRFHLNSFESPVIPGYTWSGPDLLPFVRLSSQTNPSWPPGLKHNYGGVLDVRWTQEGEITIPVSGAAETTFGSWEDIDFLSFGVSRLPENFGSTGSCTGGEPGDIPLFVTLVDNNSNSFEVDVSNFLRVDPDPTYNTPCYGISYLRTARIPMNLFCAGGVDSSVGFSEVRFRFGTSQAEMRVYLDDVEFTSSPDDEVSCSTIQPPACAVGSPGDPGCECIDVGTNSSGGSFLCTSATQDGCYPDGPGSYGNSSIGDPLSGNGQYCTGGAVCGLVPNGSGGADAQCIECPSTPGPGDPAPYGCPCFADADCDATGITGNTSGDFDGGLPVNLRCVGSADDGWNSGPGTCLPDLNPLTLVGIPGADPDPLREEFYRTRWLCKESCASLQSGASRPMACVFKPGGGVSFWTATCLEETCDGNPGQVCAANGNRCGSGSTCGDECSSAAQCASLGYPADWVCTLWNSEPRCAPPACASQPTVGGTLQTPSLSECEAYMYGGAL